MAVKTLRQLRKPGARSGAEQAGAALAVVLCVLALLSAISMAVFSTVTNRFRTIHHASAWQEALVAAEAGIHQAMAQLERALQQGALPAGAQEFTLVLAHGGETSREAEARYTIRRQNVARGGVPRPFYSIASTGSVALGGSLALSNDSRDVALRKLRLREGVASRTIEAWAAPRTSTDFALKVNEELKMNNRTVVIDSFDSRDANRSLPGGQPPKAFGQFNVAPFNILEAHIGTNGKLIEAGNATVYGDAYTNGGTVGDSDGIVGTVHDDHYEALAPVFVPPWAGSVTPGVATEKGFTTHVTSAATLRGGTAAAPARYVIDSLALAGGKDAIHFDLGLTAGNQPDPDKAHVELYVRGDMTTHGAGNSESILIANGVRVTIWFGGDVSLTGNGATNKAGLATQLSLYGVNAPTPKAEQTVSLKGNATFFGSVYAPSADLHLGNGGSKGAFVGSLVGKNAFLKGNADIRYDEALGGLGYITGFKLVSWFEDTKTAGAFDGALE